MGLTVEVISSQYWKVAADKGHAEATKHWITPTIISENVFLIIISVECGRC